MNNARRKILDQVSKDFDVREVQKNSGCTANELADVLLKFKKLAEDYYGGSVQFTGNTRVYKNGAVGYEIRCRGCNGKYWWASGIPEPYCRDCPTPRMKK